VRERFCTSSKIYGTIETWRNRPIEGERSWVGEVRNVSLLVARTAKDIERFLGSAKALKSKAGWTCTVSADHLGRKRRRLMKLFPDLDYDVRVMMGDYRAGWASATYSF
jgi:hypothetical protein